MGLKVHKWNDIKNKNMTPEKISELNVQVKRDLLIMDLRALRESAPLLRLVSPEMGVRNSIMTRGTKSVIPSELVGVSRLWRNTRA